jgi:hypothetical protein
MLIQKQTLDALEKQLFPLMMHEAMCHAHRMRINEFNMQHNHQQFVDLMMDYKALASAFMTFSNKHLPKLHLDLHGA